MIESNEKPEEDHEINDSKQPELEARELRKRNGHEYL